MLHWHPLWGVGLGLLVLLGVGALIAFAPLLQDLAGQEYSSPAPVEAPAIPTDPEPSWMVVATENKRYSGGGGEACARYQSPGGVQETCRRVAWMEDGEIKYNDDRIDCWITVRIGDPLPECWR